MCDRFKIRLQQTTHALDVLASNQRLLVDNALDEDLCALLGKYREQRHRAKQCEHQLKCATLKSKSQSQQIQDQRQRRLNSTNRASRLHKTIQQIYDIIKYRGHHTAPVDQLHYIKKICEDRLRDDIQSDEEDEDELDSRNCTIDDDQNESIIIHPRVVLPQSSTKKRLLNHDETDYEKMISPPKRLRFEDSRSTVNAPSQRIITQTTFECYTGMSSLTNSTLPFTVSTDIKMIDRSCNEQQSRLTNNSDDTLSSSTMNSTKTASSSSMEQTLPMASNKMPTIAHRFISRKIFKPETCFVCCKRINFGSVSYRCSYCSQSCHVVCKENAGSYCKTLSNDALLPPSSPKTPSMSTLKSTHRHRMICSEPRKTVLSSTGQTSNLQRRLPFERMISQKNTPGNACKYFPPI